MSDMYVRSQFVMVLHRHSAYRRCIRLWNEEAPTMTTLPSTHRVYMVVHYVYMCVCIQCDHTDEHAAAAVASIQYIYIYCFSLATMVRGRVAITPRRVLSSSRVLVRAYGGAPKAYIRTQSSAHALIHTYIYLYNRNGSFVFMRSQHTARAGCNIALPKIMIIGLVHLLEVNACVFWFEQSQTNEEITRVAHKEKNGH